MSARNFKMAGLGVHGAIVAAIALAVVPANAASIAWNSPVNETNSAADVFNTGALFGAGYVGCQQNTSDCTAPAANITVNGVTFGFQIGQSGTVAFNGNGHLSLSGVNNPGEFPVPSPGSEAGLVRQGDFSNLAAPMTLNISGLTIGQVYEVQLFAPYWNANYNSTYTAGNSVTVATGCSTGCAGTATVPQYVLGSFTADGATEAITVSDAGSYALFSAVSVFNESAVVPEPETFGLVAAGLIGFGLLRRRFAQK